MKQLMKKMVLFATLCIMIMASGYAQEPSDVEAKFNELIQKYDKVKGVECMTVVKGNGLGIKDGAEQAVRQGIPEGCDKHCHHQLQQIITRDLPCITQ